MAFAFAFAFKIQRFIRCKQVIGLVGQFPSRANVMVSIERSDICCTILLAVLYRTD